MEEYNIEDKEKNKLTNDSAIINTSANKNQAQIAGAIIIAGILIAGAILIKNNIVVDTIEGAQPFEGVMQKITDALTNDTKSITTEMRAVSLDDHILGNINAKIIIVEYSDLECPFCKVFHETMHQVVEKSNGDVAWVYRHYPIAQLHPKAFREAEATECAFEQKGNDGFWKYTDQLFKITPSNNKFDETKL